MRTCILNSILIELSCNYKDKYAYNKWKNEFYSWNDKF